RSIPEELTEELQLRLLRSHAAGVGDPYPAEIVRAAMLLRANALAKGNSGARIETVELLLECLANEVLPRVPSRGSVGASGDLARGAAGIADELPPADPPAAAATGTGRLGREHPAAARGLRDQRGAQVVRQGAGRLFAALRAAGPRRRARPARLRRGDGRGR